MTGKQFIHFIAKLRGMNDYTHAEELMHYFELDASGLIKKMSKGMKQKVGLVCAFMHHPEIVILDEPTSGLDPLMQTKFIDFILAEKDKGTTIFMSSHMIEEVEKTCDRVAIINAGKIVATETIADLKKRKSKNTCLRFKMSKSLLASLMRNTHLNESPYKSYDYYNRRSSSISSCYIQLQHYRLRCYFTITRRYIYALLRKWRYSIMNLTLFKHEFLPLLNYSPLL